MRSRPPSRPGDLPLRHRRRAAAPTRTSRPAPAPTHDLPVDADGRLRHPLYDDLHPHNDCPSSQGRSLPITAFVEAARNPWPALGTLLVRDGVITAEQLEFALAAKRRSPQIRLGEILVEHGYCNQEQIAIVLAEQHELQYVHVTLESLDMEAATLLSENLARRYCAIPIRLRGRRLGARRGRRSVERRLLRRAAPRARRTGQGRRLHEGCDRDRHRPSARGSDRRVLRRVR